MIGRGFCLRRFWRREDGTASIEFVLMVPLLLAVFVTGIEAGLMMVRETMLDRAVDIAMREVRLGNLAGASHDELRAAICARTVAIPDCENTLKIDMTPVSTVTWTLPSGRPVCRDRASPINPVTTVNPGMREDIMLVRVCAVTDAIFPTSGLAAGLPLDGNGGYQLMAVSTFVNEP